jgi:putative transposase
MPRCRRELVDGSFYHVLNRGNRKQKIFYDVVDYSTFLKYASNALDTFPVKIFAYCLMPNHFHFLVRADHSANLSKWVHSLGTRYALLFHHKHETTGHVYQGRFKSFMIENEDHLNRVTRYVERNPVQAGLVPSSYDWKWSSNYERTRNRRFLLCDEEFRTERSNWTAYVDTPLAESDIFRIQNCIKREAPFGNEEWVEQTCKRLGLEKTIRPQGRPKKKKGACPLFTSGR